MFVISNVNNFTVIEIMIIISISKYLSNTFSRVKNIHTYNFLNKKNSHKITDFKSHEYKILYLLIHCKNLPFQELIHVYSRNNKFSTSTIGKKPNNYEQYIY